MSEAKIFWESFVSTLGFIGGWYVNYMIIGIIIILLAAACMTIANKKSRKESEFYDQLLKMVEEFMRWKK